jgi:hypothetical protein
MKFRKKPVVIEAVQWIYGNEDKVRDFMKMELATEYQGELLVIETLEGTMRANQGDYIIKGVNGEFYPCKPDIFEKTYDDCTSEDAEDVEESYLNHEPKEDYGK